MSKTYQDLVQAERTERNLRATIKFFGHSAEISNHAIRPINVKQSPMIAYAHFDYEADAQKNGQRANLGHLYLSVFENLFDKLDQGAKNDFVKEVEKQTKETNKNNTEAVVDPYEGWKGALFESDVSDYPGLTFLCKKTVESMSHIEDLPPIFIAVRDPEHDELAKQVADYVALEI